MIFITVVAAIVSARLLYHPKATPQTLIDDISTRYSRNFDQHGLVMGAPSYGVSPGTALGYPREQLMAAWYYIPRAKAGDQLARTKIHDIWLQTVQRFSTPHQSIFSYAQAAAMLVALPQQIPDLFTDSDLTTMRQVLKDELPAATASTETINRGVITAVDWTYVSSQLTAANVISEEQNVTYQKAFRTLLTKSLASCVDGDGWYRENGKLSLHYQAVTAFHLMWYAALEQSPDDRALATKMFTNLRDLSFENGLIEMRFGVRPIGDSAQMSLMMGGMALALSDSSASAYFSLLHGDQFFQDPANPNRLEYHSTVAGAQPIYEDDIAASGVMMIFGAWPNIDLTQSMRLDRVIKQSVDQSIGTVHIQNNGHEITVDDTVQKTTSTATLRSNGRQTSFSSKKNT